MAAPAPAAASPPSPFNQASASDIWKACPHPCFHLYKKTIAKTPQLLQKVYLWPKGGHLNSDHKDPNKTKSHQCIQGCPGAGADWDQPTVYAAVRATILYAKAYRNGPPAGCNAQIKQWLRKVDTGASHFKGVWLDLWNAAKDQNFPDLHESSFTDGRIGPPDGPWQYPDLPTQFNTNVHPFDLAAALAGTPALPGGIMAMTPMVLYDSSVVGAIPFVIGQAPAPAPAVPAAPTVPAAPAVPVVPVPVVPTAPAVPEAPPTPPTTAPGEAGTDTGEAATPFKTPAYFRSLSNIRKDYPAQVVFVLLDDLCSKKPLKTLEDALEEEINNYYWTHIDVDLSIPAVADFYKHCQRTDEMHKMFYFDTSAGVKHTKLFLWEWAIVPFRLWCTGNVHVEFIPDQKFLRMLRKREMDDLWPIICATPLVLGTAYAHHGSETRYSAKELESVRDLATQGVQFWPHPDVDNFTRSKYRFLQAIAPAVHNAGGYAERPHLVTSLQEGLQLLQQGWVIKMDQGDEGLYVYKSNEEKERSRFTKAFKEFGSSGVHLKRRIFFALKFNRAIIELGEVRVFYCYGEVAQMFHTQPGPLATAMDVTDPVKFTSTLAENCQYQLARLQDIKPCTSMEPPTYANFRDEELWYRREHSLDTAGTVDLLKFSNAVYEALLDIEESIFQGTRDTPSASSLRLFCRLDVALVWDDEKERYLYTINEVQEGMCGLFMLGEDGKAAVPTSFINAYLRGALDHNV